MFTTPDPVADLAGLFRQVIDPLPRAYVDADDTVRRLFERINSEPCPEEWRDMGPATVFGIPITADDSLPPGVIEFRHHDGRVDRFRV